ncbi:hypothetical protein [Streptomyces sp. NPDC053560]|uniref:hypothetical protein n=1 Tax=Streptomyces sp. NPDC053560 TaxID=3365711 RepID=UPI0037D009A2
MAHLQFDPAEQSDLRAAARAEFPQNPGLAYVLELMAAEGIDLDRCQDWETLRLEVGLAPRDATGSSGVA